MSRFGVKTLLQYNNYKSSYRYTRHHLIAKRFYGPVFSEERMFVGASDRIVYLWYHYGIQYTVLIESGIRQIAYRGERYIIIQFYVEYRDCGKCKFRHSLTIYNRNLPTLEDRKALRHVLYKRMLKHYIPVIPFLRELIGY